MQVYSKTRENTNEKNEFTNSNNIQEEVLLQDNHSQEEEYKKLLNDFKNKYIPFSTESLYNSIITKPKQIRSPYILEQMHEKTTPEALEKSRTVQCRTIDLRDSPSVTNIINSFHRENSLLNSKAIIKRKPMDISQRCNVWLKAKERKIKELRENESTKEMDECTFKPSRITERSSLAKAYELAVESKNEALYNYTLSKRQEGSKVSNELPEEKNSFTHDE